MANRQNCRGDSADLKPVDRREQRGRAMADIESAGNEIATEEVIGAVAAALNEIVVSGIFEAGLVLEGARLRCTDPHAVELIDEAVGILDETIAKVRTLVLADYGTQAWDRRVERG